MDNFLRHWENGIYPRELRRKPVTWVSIEDARAYAKWAGKRLPHEWEWQYAIQSTDGRLYPQGSAWYFPQASRLDTHGKYLLMAPSRDRSATIGFRCVKDTNK